MAMTVEVEASVEPAVRYSFVAPFDGEVRKLAPTDTVCQPVPPDVPSGIYIEAYDPDAEYAYRLKIAANSFAHIEPTDHALIHDAVGRRQWVVNERLRSYDLPTYQASRAPWHDLEFTQPLVSKFLRFASEYLFKSGTNTMEQFRALIDALDRVSTGDVPDEIRPLLKHVTLRLERNVNFAEVHSHLRSLFVWIYRGEENVAAEWGIRHRPYLPIYLEPNSTDLLKRGKIDIIIPRVQPTLSGIRVTIVPADLNRFLQYWKEVKSQRLLSLKDKYFLDQLIRERHLETGDGTSADFSEKARDIALSSMIEDIENAILLFAGLSRLPRFIGSLCEDAVFHRDIGKNTEVMKSAIGAAERDDTALKEFRDGAPEWMYAIASYIPVQEKPGIFIPPRQPSVRTKMRLLNELRPSIRYDGEFFSISERNGYLQTDYYVNAAGSKNYFLGKDFYLWTTKLPSTLSDSEAPPMGIAPPASAWASMGLPEPLSTYEVEEALIFGLSGLAIEVAETGDLDDLANFLRELESRKMRAGEELAKAGSQMRETQRLLLEGYWRAMESRRDGNFFPPDAARMISLHVKVGDYVERGDVICTMTPVFQFAFSASSFWTDWDTHPFVGQRANVEILSTLQLALGHLATQIDALPDAREIEAGLQAGFNRHIANIQLPALFADARSNREDPTKCQFTLVVDIPESKRCLTVDVLGPATLQRLKKAGLISTSPNGEDCFILPDGLIADRSSARFRISLNNG